MTRFQWATARAARRLGINLNWLFAPVITWQRSEPFLLKNMHKTEEID
ncbi:hypothetical protein [Aliiroseovarius crassostreae]